MKLPNRLKQVGSSVVIFATAIGLSACAQNSKKGEAEHPINADAPASKKSAPDAGSSIEAKQLAATEQATYVTEISFAKKKSTLSKEDEAKLKKIYEQAKKVGTVGEIKEISWSDSEFPSVNTKKLPDAELKLARDRNEAITQFYKKAAADPAIVIKGYSMAERSGSLSALLGSDDAKIKKSLEVAGIPNTDTSSKVNAKASKSIVMVFLKDKENKDVSK